MAVFWQFLSSNALIMLYNICYCWFFLSQGKWWTKYLVHPKIRRPKPCQLLFASLVALDGFHLLLFTQLTADLTPKWSGASIFHPLSHTYTKTLFCCVETIANNALNHRLVVVLDRLWANETHLLWIGFSLTNVHANFEYTAFRYLQILCYLQQLQFKIGQNEFVEFFFVFFRDNCCIWRTWAFSIICVCTIAFKISISPLNCCFWQSRAWITFIKPLLCLKSIFPSEIHGHYTKFRFFHCFENLQS